MKIIQGQEKVILRAVSPDGGTTSGDLLVAYAEDSGSTGIRISKLEVETQTVLNSTTTTIEDPFLEVNRNNSTADGEDSGIFFNRGSEDHALFYWDKDDNNFVVGTTTHEATITAVTNVTLGQIKVATTPTDSNHAASKSYVDSRTITVAGDDSAAITIDFDDAELVFTGGTSITTDTTAGGNSVKISVDAAMTGINSITSASSENITLNADSDLVVINDQLTFNSQLSSDPSAANIAKLYAKNPAEGGTGLYVIHSGINGGEPTELMGQTSNNLVIFGDDSTTMEILIPDIALNVSGGNSITTSTSSTQTLTVALDNQISVNEISSGDSTGVTIKDDLLLAGTLRSEDSTTVSVDGAMDISGAVTVNAGVSIDNITIDGTEIDLSTGDLTLDIEGDLIVDVNGADVKFTDDGTEFGRLSRVSSDLVIKSMGNNQDILLKGLDDTSTITALQLDMSEAGNATFSGAITHPGATIMTPVDDLATSTTALSLTATVHSLAVGEADYTLAAGTEGQIMHFVIAGGDSVIGNVANTTITISQVRDPDDGDVLATYAWSPFIGNQAGDSTTPKRTLATCVFANGAWNLDQYNDIT